MKTYLLLFFLPACLFWRQSDGQAIYTFAGNGITGYTDSGGVPTLAEFNHPWGLAVDNSGNLYIADHVNSAIRKITAAGAISTYAGTTTLGYGGDNGPASAAMMKRPAGIALDAAGDLYIADGLDNRIRKINASGIITTIAGNDTAAYTGDGGAATAATLNTPTGVAVDAVGNVYIADSGNNVIRKIDLAGNINTFAGTGASAYTGDGGPASAATFAGPEGISIDGSGNIYIADHLNNVVRKINTLLTVSTFAGNGVPGFSGDGGPATAAQLTSPNSVAFDSAGNIYISDEYNNRVRMVNSGGNITTLAGNGSAGNSGDGGPATDAQLFRPMGLAIDAHDNIYIADYINSIVRVVRLEKTYSNMPTALANATEPTIFPVPCHDIIQVTFNCVITGKMQIEIQNILGQQLYMASCNENSVRIDVSSFTEGCYILSYYRDNTKISHTRFTKN